MKDNTDLIEALISLTGTIVDDKGNEFSDVYLFDWDEIIETIRDYDSVKKEEN